MKVMKRILIVVAVFFGVVFVIGMFSGGDADSTDNQVSSADEDILTEDKGDADTIEGADDSEEELEDGMTENADSDDGGDGWSDTYNAGSYEDAQSSDIKATFGTYLTEEDDPPYEMTIGDNGSGGVYVRIVADNNEFYCPDAYFVERELDDWEESLYNGIRIIAINDDEEDEEELHIEVGANKSMWILDAYSEYFGQYMKK